MKKHFVSLVAFVSLLALASCAETSSTTPSSSNSTVENSTTSAEENSTTTSTTTDSTTTSTTNTTTISDSTVTDVEVTEVKLNKTSLTLEIGKSETLTATVLPENATDKSVSWTSDNEKIATVDANGKVTAVAAGETLITVTSKNGKKATCDVTVNAPAPAFTSIADVKDLADGTTFTTRGYWMGTNGVVDSKFHNYNAAYIADGSDYYLLYHLSASMIQDLDLVVGETIVEIEGKVDNYTPTDDNTGAVTGYTTYEATVTSLKVISDDSGLTQPVVPVLNAENPDLELTESMLGTRVRVEDAVVKSFDNDNDYKNTTITFTVGEGTTEYTLYLDSRYTDLDLIAGLGVGTTFSTYTYVSSHNYDLQFVYIDEIDFVPDTSETFDDAIEVSVSEFIAAEGKEGKLYKLTGVIGEITNTEYGNGTLYDAETGEELTLYGLSGAKSALSFSGTWSFDNAKDYSTNVAGKFEEGDEIVMYGVYEDFQGTPEIMGVFDSVSRKKENITYEVVVDEGIVNGKVEASATSGIYGDTINLTITPDDGYRLNAISVSGRAINPEDGTYSFEVLPGENYVTATFVSSSAAVTNVTITADLLGLGDYGEGSTDIAVGTDFVSLSWTELGDYGHGIQWRMKNGKTAALWNTTEMPYAIDSIELHYNSEMKSTTARLGIEFGTAAITSNVANQDIAYSAGETVETIECDVENATYFRINHVVTGAFYFDSIVINFVQA